jgi:Protein of unknown function (DUF3551)
MQQLSNSVKAFFIAANSFAVVWPASAESYPVCLAGGETNSIRCEFANAEQCRASAAGGAGYCVRNPAYSAAKDATGLAQTDDAVVSMARLPWPAPVGHRQPRSSDIPNGVQASEFEPARHWLDRELDGKLKICRGC